jgi:hypothetical protein
MGVLHWFEALSRRLERVRVIHGDWSRCLNHHFGGNDTAIFFDPPYRGFERLYAKDSSQPLIADEVAKWCREEGAGLRIALCGHVGDYELPGWSVFEWSRGKFTYGGSGTTDAEAIWFSPACSAQKKQFGLFDATPAPTPPIPQLQADAVAATRFRYGEPPTLGMVTFVDRDHVTPTKVRGEDTWGWTYRKAGFQPDGETKGGLLAFRLPPEAMPPAIPALGSASAQLALSIEATP